jgi:hypothetical protein
MQVWAPGIACGHIRYHRQFDDSSLIVWQEQRSHLEKSKMSDTDTNIPDRRCVNLVWWWTWDYLKQSVISHVEVLIDRSKASDKKIVTDSRSKSIGVTGCPTVEKRFEDPPTLLWENWKAIIEKWYVETDVDRNRIADIHEPRLARQNPRPSSKWVSAHGDRAHYGGREKVPKYELWKRSSCVSRYRMKSG